MRLSLLVSLSLSFFAYTSAYSSQHSPTDNSISIISIEDKKYLYSQLVSELCQAGMSNIPNSEYVIDRGELNLDGKLQPLEPNKRQKIIHIIEQMTWLKNLNISQAVSDHPDDKLTCDFTKLTQLTQLNLNHNKLGKVPQGLYNLSHLTKLELRNNNLENIPEGINVLSQLTYLDISQNRLPDLPDTFGNLTSLAALNLGQNRFQEIPSSLENLINLDALILQDNQLHSVPDWLGNLHQLQMLSLFSNRLQTLPESIGNLVNLIQLFLHGNQLQTIPSSLANLPNIVLLGLLANPHLLPEGPSEALWGRREIQDHFQYRAMLDRANADVEAMDPTTTKDKVYEALNQQQPRVNRPIFTNNKLPDFLVRQVFSGPEMLQALDVILQTLNFTQEQGSGYISYNILANDFRNNEVLFSHFPNKERILLDLYPRIIGYFKTLYGIPLNAGEQGGWKMYQDQIPDTQKALTFILTSLLEQKDSDIQAIWFTQLIHGLLHCPTGQAEGINAVAHGIMEGGYKNREFKALIHQILAVKKNSAFTQSILARGVYNGQNVHLISYYRDLLKEELGLTSAIESYHERMGIFGDDPFSNNQWNVVQTFYELVTPQRLIQWIADTTQTMDDRLDLEMLRLVESLGKKTTLTKDLLKSRILNIKAKLAQEHLDLFEDDLSGKSLTDISNLITSRKQELEQELKSAELALNRDVHKQQKETASIIKEKVVPYLLKHKLLKMKHWQKWFHHHPLKDNNPILRDEGALYLLQYLKVRTKHNIQSRPLTVGDTIRYLMDEKLIDPDQDFNGWWKGYFNDNPEFNELALLTRHGVTAILTHMGYLTQE